MTMSSDDSPARAESDAETARAGLVSTLGQLRENLRPANVVDEVMSSAKENVSAITDQMWATAKKNPLPALMIGAGLAMIFGVGARSVRSGSAQPSHRVAGSSGPGPEFRSHVAQMSSGTERSSGIAGQAAAAMSSVSDRATDLLGSANERLAAAASRGSAAISGAYSNAKGSDAMSWSRQNAGSSLNYLLEEQPLILAAVGVAIGAALGAALPHTQTEDSLMGEASGSIKSAAQELAQDRMAQVKSAASQAVDDIKQSVADHGITTDNLTGLVQDVGGKAKSAVYDAGLADNQKS